MAQQNRANLKSYFLTGSKPTQAQFADLIDSVINKADDGITIDGSNNVSLAQGISIKGSTLDTPGSIRWNGTTFQFRDNGGWKDLALGAAASQWTTVSGNNINLLAGNVGIGLASGVSPTYRLEVNLGLTSGTVDQVRFGSAIIFSQLGNAYFSHKNVANTTSYGLLQDTTGQTIINSAASTSILFCEANAPKAAISKGVLCVNATAAPSGSTVSLFVNGEAGKPSGGSWVSVGSDERLKTGIAPFNDGLSLLKKLNPVTYRYNGKAGIANTKEHVGLIAQEVLNVFPYMVGHFKARLEDADTHETDLLSLDTSALTYIMVNALKELDDRLNKLEKKQAKSVSIKQA